MDDDDDVDGNTLRAGMTVMNNSTQHSSIKQYNRTEPSEHPAMYTIVVRNVGTCHCLFTPTLPTISIASNFTTVSITA